MFLQKKFATCRLAEDWVTVLSREIIKCFSRERVFEATHVPSSRVSSSEETLLHYIWWKCKLVQPLWKMVWQFLKKPMYDPTIPLLGIFPDKAIIQKGACTPVCMASVFTIIKAQKQLKCPSTEE